MSPFARETLERTVVPASVVLCLAAVAERLGAEGATFYLFLVGIPICAAGGLAAIGRPIEAAGNGEPAALGRLQAWISSLLVGVFAIGAAARSPVLVDVGGPALVPTAVALGLCLVALLAIAAAVPVRR